MTVYKSGAKENVSDTSKPDIQALVFTIWAVSVFCLRFVYPSLLLPKVS